MAADKKSKILDSLAAITKHKDSELLEISLAKTIYELFGALGVSFFRMPADDPVCYSVISVTDKGLSLIHEREGIEAMAEPFRERFADIRKTGGRARFPVGDSEVEVRPLTLSRSIVGFLTISFPRGTDIDDNVIAGFLNVYSNYHDLLLENQKDTLTGLLNRKTFEEKLHRFMETQVKDSSDAEPGESRRARPDPSWGFWLGMFDIDDFKKVNDTYGHVFGDEVLILISNVIRESFRPLDIKLRFGGEEFVVVIRARGKDEAISVFDRFRKAVASREFGVAGKVTVSVGLIEVDPAEPTVSVVGRADQALYQAKKSGKNVVCAYEDLVAAGIVGKEIQYGDVVLFG